jgi:two-component system OmpR family response regulator
MSIQALVLEDDLLVANLLKHSLSLEGVKATHCTTMNCARRAIDDSPFELALIDRMLGNEDGLDFVAYARKKHPGMGIIVISGKGLPSDRILGLENGADDYVTKPLEPREVALRARRLAGRRKIMQADTACDDVFRFQDWVLDPVARSLRHEQAGLVQLTGREFDVLLCLVRLENHLVSRQSLLYAIHQREHVHVSPRTIDTLVSNIRHKLRNAQGHDPIVTIRNKGYALGARVTRLSPNLAGSAAGD